MGRWRGPRRRSSRRAHRRDQRGARRGPDDLADGETIVARRRRETECSAEVLGIHHVLWLGYSDSGMTGWDQNTDPDSFWQADVDDAAARLAKLLEAEHADVLVTYDWHGGYGHPDHVQAHGSATGPPPSPHARVLEATFSRDAMRSFSMDELSEDWDPDGRPTTATRSGRRDRHPPCRRRRRLRGPQATGAGVPCQPDERRRGDAGDAGGDVRQGVRHRVVHRARPSPRAPPGLAVRLEERLISGRPVVTVFRSTTDHRPEKMLLVAPALAATARGAAARAGVAGAGADHRHAALHAQRGVGRRGYAAAGVLSRHRRGDTGADLVGELAGRRQRFRVGDHSDPEPSRRPPPRAREASAASAPTPRRSTARRAPRTSSTPSPACGTGSPSPRRRSGSPGRRSSRPARIACS